MELDAEHLLARHEADEPLAVFGRPDDVPGAGWSDDERVHVVKRRTGDRQPVRQRTVALKPDLTPADMRDPHPRGLECYDVTGDQPESACTVKLGGAVKQQLHPEADA